MTPVLIPAGSYSLPALWFGPHNAQQRVLHLPAFGDEMNKSRAVVAAQARAWAEQGIAVLVPDWFGTGDAPGDYLDASWQGWLDDASVALQFLSNSATIVHLWGLRTGCLLAAQLYAQHPQTVSGAILWQPVSSGKRYLSQVLRVRSTAAMMRGKKESVSSLRQQLLDDGSLEVSGYALNSALFTEIEATSLADISLPQDAQLHWLEVVADPEAEVSPATTRETAQLTANGVTVVHQQVGGDTFWSTVELASAPALIATTTSALAGSAEQAPEPDIEAATASQGEQLTTFDCSGDQLCGVYHAPEGEPHSAVLMVVGGPQYRVGSHRQYLKLARALAADGVAVLRFDYRGMGDSEGNYRGFEYIDEDIAAALSHLAVLAPGAEHRVLLGLCDGATAAAFYAARHEGVDGLVLYNPWVHSPEGQARALLKHYYWQRLVNGAFWRKLLSGELQIGRSLRALFGNVSTSRPATATREASSHGASAENEPLVPRLEAALKAFSGPQLFVLSGQDFTAAEFEDAVRQNRPLGRLMTRPQVRVERLPDSDHTFSRAAWKAQLADITRNWIHSL